MTSFDFDNVYQGSRCLLEIYVNWHKTLHILCQWHEKYVQYNLEKLMHITKPKWWRNLIVAHGL